MEAVVIFAFFGGLVGLIVYANGKHKARVRQFGRDLRGLLANASIDDASTDARGTFRDLDVRCHLTSRGSGKHRVNWTEIQVELPQAYPLVLYVRPHAWFDRGKIERGELVDVRLGDSTFDDRFAIEAAPADVVAELLDRSTRDYLASEARVELTTTERDGQRVLQLALPRWLDTLEQARPAIEVATSMAARVREAYARADRRHAPTATGQVYRPMLDGSAQEVAQRAREHEIRAVEHVQRHRAAVDNQRAVMILVGLGLFLLLMLALTHQ